VNLKKLFPVVFFAFYLLWQFPTPSLAQTTYEYDDLGRLTSVTYGGGEMVDYSYDPAGNRSSVATAGAPAPTIDVGDAAAIEGSDLIFTVTRSVITSGAFNVDYATTDGSAVAASDYTTASGMLSFASGELTKTVTVTTLQDSLFENIETVNLTLSNATNGAFISDATAVGTVNDDDAGPVFSVNNASIAEGGVLSFTVTKTGATAKSHNVNYASGGGDATAGVDYTVASGTLTFTSAETSKTVTVTTLQDAAYESDETVNITLSGATDGANASAVAGVGTITNDDTDPSLSINAVSINEGGNLIFTVTLVGNTTMSHSVDYVTSDGTATAGSDYTAASGTITFAVGETTKTISIATIADTVGEANETVNVTLSAATNGAVLSGAIGLGTITDGPSFSVNNVAINEGGSLSFTVTRTGSTAAANSVNYATANGTALSTSDYTAASGTLSFASGQATKTVTIVTTVDLTYENNETVNLNLTNPTNSASISDTQGVGTINNDDAAPSFSVNNVSISEGGNLSFIVTKAGATAKSHNVNYATANGTAASGSDYTSKSGTVSFTSAETSKTVTVATLGDSVYENNETVNLNLSAATSGATISDSLGIGTINNNDTAPAFSVNNTSVSEGGTLSFTVTKTGSTALSHNINYATANGTATAGSDYTSKSGVLTFTSGQTSKAVTVTTIEDTAVEPNETVKLNFSSATGGATISDSQGIGTINNDDVANTPPVANNDNASGPQNVNLVLLPLTNDTDANNDPLSIQSFTLSAGLTLLGSTSTSITVRSSLSGNRTVTYVASDGNGGTDSATVSISFTQTCGTRLC